MKYFLFFIFIFCYAPFISLGQKKVLKELQSAQNTISPFKPNLFSISNNRNTHLVPDEITNYSLLKLDKSVLRDLKSQRQPYIQLTIPQSGRNNLVLELIESDLFTSDFSVVLAPAMQRVEHKPIKHYHGILQGNEKSFVAISILEDEIMGIISHPAAVGSLVIGKLSNSEEHIVYQDHQIASKNPLSCQTEESTILQYSNEQLRFRKPSQRNGDKCVGMYLEIDYDIYQNKGSDVNTTIAYITALMNQVILLYKNDDINARLSEIVVWTEPSPYNGATSMDMLSSFRNQRPTFKGDIAQLLSFKTNGGVAYVNTLCNNNKSYRTSFSRIQATFQNIPTYSWSVHVVAHEFGHILGSQHTHACAWNGNNTAIDGCFSTEGSCANPGVPDMGGTIMSYCHISSPGINFSNGFGPQPGNIIRSNIHNASCLSTCDNFSEDDTACDGQNIKMELRTDAYPSETSWQLKNANGQTVASGNSYSSSHTVYSHDICVANGCYELLVRDQYGDGMCCKYGEGYFQVKNGSDILLQGGQFSAESKHIFCINSPIPTCDDGIKNGNEVGIDCGGDCPPCATCDDGIKNGNEVGIDCGGDCPPCATCDDGIKNGNEVGIDCGGDCPPCATCDDGIKNGNEEGIDCGGDCPPCNVVVSNTRDTLLGHYFEVNWEGWERGGNDATRIRSIHSPEGNFSLRLRGGQGTSSSVISPEIDITHHNKLVLHFSFKCVSTEPGKGFKLQISNKEVWSDQKEWLVSNNLFTNTLYKDSIVFEGAWTEPIKFRFQNLGTDNSDLTYIDAINLIGLKSQDAPQSTCSDGIMNGTETGIDCGGDCPACINNDDDNDDDNNDEVVISTTELVGYYFEQDMEGWGRGGSHAARVYSIHSPEGFYSLRLRNGQGIASSVISPLVSLENVDSLRIDFSFKGVGYEVGKSFKIEYFDGSVWHDVKIWVAGTDFVTNQTTSLTCTIPLHVSSFSQLRITGMGQDNSDLVYFDAIQFFAYHKENEIPNMYLLNVHPLETEAVKIPTLLPNPADSYVEISAEEVPQKVQLFNISGQLLAEIPHAQRINVSHYLSGMYMVVIHMENNIYNLKMIKN